jgi:hypothetical protein
MKQKGRLTKRLLPIFALLFTVNWIAHFLYFTSLGLYEDDYVYVTYPMGWSTNDLWLAIISNLTHWPQGRPLGFSIPEVINFVGYRLGGLPTIYVVGAIIVTLNAFLFYLILKSMGSDLIAVLGALVFLLFPADTTRSYLMHLTGLQPSLTFFLIATLLYINDKPKLSFAVIVGALLTYESGFIMFSGVPLLKRPWNREWGRTFLRHAAALGAIMVADFVLRGFLGDSRVAMGYRVILIPPKIIGGMVIGPFVSMAQFLLAPIRTLPNLDSMIMPAAIFCFAVFVMVLANLKPDVRDQRLVSLTPSASSPKTAKNLQRKSGLCAALESMFRGSGDGEYWLAAIQSWLTANRLNPNITGYCAKTAQYPVVGVTWLIIAYGLSFTHFPPTVQYGRLTSVHLAAAFGASILVAWMCTVLLFAARVFGMRRIAIAGLALYFALLVAYGIIIQKDLQLSWQYQRSFWTRVVELTPDLSDGTVIFALRNDLPETRYIVTPSWADPSVLYQLFRFPIGWKQAPRLFVVDGNWDKMIRVHGDGFEWSVPVATWPPHQENLPDGNVILLKVIDGRLVREYGTIDIQGKSLHFKATVPDGSLQFETGPLYNLLIDQSEFGSR